MILVEFGTELVQQYSQNTIFRPKVANSTQSIPLLYNEITLHRNFVTLRQKGTIRTNFVSIEHFSRAQD